ncbi:dihydrofolate reductase family protein [Desulfobaculum bizertense]|uniref:dihydrofolate reductase family protein n=1 Tax=Desulfobaculum bizertense TaxID=376490 RepID=UPI001F397E40|nr:dihydrofolate reductase family protein [Desulfobaculum bizertense]UIJ38993.1 dihydrofolate reductase family protein [Desulfobaculum bizertense]
MPNKVFIATSLDGYIADRNGGLDFLGTVPNPEGLDLGFVPLMESVDALLMGRKTLDAVLSFDVPWPYSKPVFVLSSTMKAAPEALAGKLEIVSGDVRDVVNDLNARGFRKLYVDGGTLIQSLLAEDLIDDLIVSQIPVLLGGGVPLFGALSKHLEFELVKSEVFLDAIVQSHYRRKR